MGETRRRVFKLVKLLVFLIVVALIGVAGFAYLGDLSPERAERSVPVSLDAR